MKRILFFIPLLLISLTVFSQADQIRTSPIGSSPSNLSTYNKRTVVDANLKASLTLYIPKGATPTLNNAKDSVGAVFFSTTDSHFYVYRGSNTWDKYATIADISSVVTDSLANYQKLPNTVITGCTITVNGDSITVSAGTYRINGQVYSANQRIFPNIPYSPNGTQRYLTFVGTTGGVIDSLGGTADSIAVFPPIAFNQADLGSVLIGSGSIGEPSTPTEILAGGAITSNDVIGFNAGVNLTPAQFIQNVFYRSQNPTTSISGGQTLEFRPAGTTVYTLNWSGGRLGGTQPLSSIVVAGVAQTFSQPSAGASVSGTQNVTVTHNVGGTYTNTVTTLDSKTASASTTFTYLPRRFWGRSLGSVPTNAEILSALGGGSELSGVKAKSNFIITASGSNYIFYAYPSILGDLTSLTIGGFESLPAFTRGLIPVTNSFGFTITYNVYISNNTFSANTPSIIAQ